MTQITKIVIAGPEPDVREVNIVGDISHFELLAMKGAIVVGGTTDSHLAWATPTAERVRKFTTLWALIEDVLDHVTVSENGQTLLVHSKPSVDREVDKRRAKLAAAGILIEETDADCFAWTANINGYTLQAIHHSSFGSALNDAEAFHKAMVNMADNAVYKVRQAFAHLMERKGIVSNAALLTVLAHLDEAAKSYIKEQGRGEP